MSKEKLTNQLKKAYKSLEEEFKNKGRPNTIEDNNVDYDNSNIYAMRQKIKDLEAKLAEMTEKYNACQEVRKLEADFNKQDKRDLKRQLAEKEKEIEQLNNRILISQLQAPKEQILNILGSQCIQYNPDQSKTEFAIEKLQRVKEEINSYNKHHCFLSTEKDTCDKSVEIVDVIIKELEGKSESKSN